MPVIIALSMLTSAVFFLFQNDQEIANQNAAYAYYFLIAAILWKIIQYLIGKHLAKNKIFTKKFEQKI
jgi:predicted CDP-diglyceride synthetase/phosphatidate cytidylyltransferase